jgi:hypothetical protein
LFGILVDWEVFFYGFGLMGGSYVCIVEPHSLAAYTIESEIMSTVFLDSALVRDHPDQLVGLRSFLIERILTDL